MDGGPCGKWYDEVNNMPYKDLSKRRECQKRYRKKKLCPMCNKGVGMFYDNPMFLINASLYLRKSS